MKVEVVTPEEFMGDVMGDLNSRRGRIEGMEKGAIRRLSGPRPARFDVRLRYGPSLCDTGQGFIYDAILTLRGSSGEHRSGTGGKQSLSRAFTPVAWAP